MQKLHVIAFVRTIEYENWLNMKNNNNLDTWPIHDGPNFKKKKN
jgi:hypothetical protein